MGCFVSKDKLTKEDMDFLKTHTSYDETTIKEWYKGFKVSYKTRLNKFASRLLLNRRIMNSRVLRIFSLFTRYKTTQSRLKTDVDIQLKYVLFVHSVLIPEFFEIHLIKMLLCYLLSTVFRVFTSFKIFVVFCN